MKVKLVVVGGTTKNQEVRPRLPATIGRGRECSVQLPHPLVSRTHCELYEESGRVYVRDLSALNGTFVDGQKVACAPLVSGSMLIVGPITFRVELEAAEAVPAPADLVPSPVSSPAPMATPNPVPRAAAPAATALPAGALAAAGLARGAIPMALPLPGTAAAAAIPTAAIPAVALPTAALPAAALPAAALPAAALPAAALPATALPAPQPIPTPPTAAPSAEPAPINGTTTEAELADF
ncbi:MAG: FHA domain-containing protein, partial [Planctomycetota bacterium]